MRKTIIGRDLHPSTAQMPPWMNLVNLAQVELSSEDPTHPIESALFGKAPGWRAAAPGPQTIRLLFDAPLQIRKIRLKFQEEERSRSQEFLLRFSTDGGRTFRDVVRQQYNLSPPGTATELEEYSVELSGVSTLELTIIPDIGGGEARAQLSEFLLA